MQIVRGTQSNATAGVRRKPARLERVLVSHAVAGSTIPDDSMHLERRAVLVCLMAGMSRPCQAEEAVASTSSSSPVASTNVTEQCGSEAESPGGVLFEDDEYTYTAPPGFNYFDIPIKRVERGPAPERSPIRSRFESSDGTASVSVVVRVAQGLSFTFTQVNDVSAYGTPEEAAKLLVPRGSVLISARAQVVEIPPKETLIGVLDVPPKSYYIYEFISPQNDHIAMAVAAARGKLYVCGGAARKDQWSTYSQRLMATVQSFRIK